MKILLTLFSIASAADFWKGFNETEEPYQHPWKDIPDLIDNKTVGFWFNITNSMLLGVERGMYNNKSLTVNSNCFGPRYVTKANQLMAMFKDKNIWKHLLPIAAILY
jgi:hypothetical protein